MKKRALAGLACGLALAACSNSTPQTPDDGQITALLRQSRAAADDPQAKLDSSAVSCLRAWSGDAKLAEGLSRGLDTDAGKKACRDQLEPWFADAARNPQTFTFESFSKPAVARRALELQTARAGLPHLGAPPPAALTAPRPLAPVVQVDLGAAGVPLKESEDVCQQVQQRAKSEPGNQRARRFGDFCARHLQALRISMEQALEKHDQARIDELTEEARRLGTVGNEAIQTQP